MEHFTTLGHEVTDEAYRDGSRDHVSRKENA
jgi:hypothetical protein